MNAAEAMGRMKAPAASRPGWLVTQVMVGRACSESCVSCTQGSQLAGRVPFMSVDDFETAIKCLEGFPGTIGLFGGQPTLHPKFPELCEIIRAHVPYLNRGIWTNALNGHGAVCRITFRPDRSNINVHTSRENYEEFARDWPEAIEARRQHVENGLNVDSMHGAPFVAMKDVEPDESKRWDMISSCDVNQNWSSCTGSVPGRGLRSYFCELAFAQANLHASMNPDDPSFPDLGIPTHPGWWKKPMRDFEAQVRLHCHACGIPMRRPPQPAVGGTHEEFSATHAAIARPKVKGRAVEFVTIGGMAERSDRPSTNYLPGTTPGYRGDA